MTRAKLLAATFFQAPGQVCTVSDTGPSPPPGPGQLEGIVILKSSYAPIFDSEMSQQPESQPKTSQRTTTTRMCSSRAAVTGFNKPLRQCQIELAEAIKRNRLKLRDTLKSVSES